VRLQCKLRRIGRNGQKGFWCGFCQTVVELKKRGLQVRILWSGLILWNDLKVAIETLTRNTLGMG